jgi:hypothetical protein
VTKKARGFITTRFSGETKSSSTLWVGGHADIHINSKLNKKILKSDTAPIFYWRNLNLSNFFFAIEAVLKELEHLPLPDFSGKAKIAHCLFGWVGR